MNSPFALRPLERTTGPADALEGAFRVHLSQKELKSLGLANTDLVRIKTSSGFKGYGVAWLASQTNPGNKPIAKVTELLRQQYGLSLSDHVFLEKATDSIKPLQSIQISFHDHSDQAPLFASSEDLLYWVRESLNDIDVILPSFSIPIRPRGPKYLLKGSKLRVTVQAIEPHADEQHAVYYDHSTTQINTINETASQKSEPLATRALQVKSDGIGGLSNHIATINKKLYMFTKASLTLPNSRGLTTFLIHGPEGTGKSLLLDRIRQCRWQTVHQLDLDTHTKILPKTISDTFKAALENQPSLILMDNLDKFLEKAATVVVRLQAELAKLNGHHVVVAAAARNIYDIDASLRTAKTFNNILELYAPNADQREDILRQILGPTRVFTKIDLAALADRSHGFVGRDLDHLCTLAQDYHAERIFDSLGDDKRHSWDEIDEVREFDSQEAFDVVFDQVQPTVLKDSIIEVPKVKWTDIAGLDHVRTLIEAIAIRPIKYPELDAEAGIHSRKGVLLYGPPGCAKTLIAQAVATESKQNFLAVKGSELIKMYVGESERAIRDIFRRARAAKPCIIFFDEIDSIGKARDKTNDSGLNVVATLLNELDGIEALKNVVVIGATNRPDILDSALIRTGRFDAHIHIGLPNEEARKQILLIHTRNSPLATDVNLDSVATRLEGSSGADIKGLCTRAAEEAIMEWQMGSDVERKVRMCHFEEALKNHVPHTMKEEADRYKTWRPGTSLSD